jgi:hypothetical protein
MIFIKPYTLAGFEPGSSDPEADVMSTAPRRQGHASKYYMSIINGLSKNNFLTQ